MTSAPVKNAGPLPNYINTQHLQQLGNHLGGEHLHREIAGEGYRPDRRF